MDTVEYSNEDFADIFDKQYRDNCSVEWLKRHPNAIAQNLKQFIFHDELYKKMDDKMQATLQACLLRA